MNTPVIRMVARPLEDGSTGVLHQLTMLTPDEDDTIPAAPTILNTADHQQAVRPDRKEALPVLDWPALVVTCETPSELVLAGVYGKPLEVPNFPVMIFYITGETMDLVEAWKAADYTFRAVVWSLMYGLFASDKAD